MPQWPLQNWGKLWPLQAIAMAAIHGVSHTNSNKLKCCSPPHLKKGEIHWNPSYGKSLQCSQCHQTPSGLYPHCGFSFRPIHQMLAKSHYICDWYIRLYLCIPLYIYISRSRHIPLIYPIIPVNLFVPLFLFYFIYTISIDLSHDPSIIIHHCDTKWATKFAIQKK